MGHVAEVDKSILRELARGCDLKTTATRTGFALSTIKNRLGPLYAALGARNGTGAVVLALKEGIISLDDV